jgi:hypothetical protein
MKPWDVGGSLFICQLWSVTFTRAVQQLIQALKIVSLAKDDASIKKVVI